MNTILATKVIAGFACGIGVFGTITNLFTLTTICMREKLRNVSTFVFIAFVSVSDTLCLYPLLSNVVFDAFLGGNIGNSSLFACKAFLFLQAFFLYSSAWLLVCMCIERCLTVCIQKWKYFNFNSTKATITSMMVIAISAGLNMPLIFNTEYIKVEKMVANNTVMINICSYNLEFLISWSQISSFGFTFVPFILIAIANFILIFKIIRGSSTKITRNSEEKAKRRSISISLVIITLSFIVLTGPSSLLQGFARQLMALPNGMVILKSLNLFFYLYYGSNFMFLVCFNKLFRHEFKKNLRFVKIKKNIEETTFSQQTNRTFANIESKI